MPTPENLDDWQIAGIEKAIRSLDNGKGISHERVRDWLMSWGAAKELPIPESTD
jgi:predicted transcriptional regulator